MEGGYVMRDQTLSHFTTATVVDWMLERFKLAAESHSRNKIYQLWKYGNHP